MFYSYIIQNSSSFHKKTILAEDVFTYFEHSDYQDLLGFERDLAELSSLTVLFTESPGSIAELGSFAVLKTIRERLLVVMHQDNAHKESFIWRGPVLALQNHAKSKEKEDPITVYKWQKNRDSNGYFSNGEFPDALDLAETIESIIRKRPKTKFFNKYRTEHIMLLIISFIDIVRIALLDEVCFALKFFGIKVRQKQVKQYLSLLMSLGLIHSKPYRNYVFFLAPQGDWFSWSYYPEAGKKRNAARWGYHFIDIYKDSQPEKYRALRSYFKSTG